MTIPAFPGAYGWGASSIGGRGGAVVEVTNLNPGGDGSLKAALTDAIGPRIVVFRVGGEIDMTGDQLTVFNPYVTVAGQTAPGGGITITGGGFRFLTHNIIMRYISFRGSTIGGGSGGIPLIVRPNAGGVHDIILDHCSMQWSADDMISINHNDESIPEKIHNITIQDCLFGYPSAAHPTSVLIANNAGFGYVHHISIHNNLWSTSGNRNPNVQGNEFIEVINNFVYNYRHRVGEVGVDLPRVQGSEVDYIGNYWHRNAALSGDNFVLWQAEGGTPIDPSIYARGNIAPVAGGRLAGPILDPDADNWDFFSDSVDGSALPETYKRAIRLAQSPHPIPEVLATEARIRILENAGNNARLNSDGTWTPRRDAYDLALLDEARNDTGGDPFNAPDIPVSLNPVATGTAYLDTDADGMADEWETAKDLDPGDPADGPIVGPSGYSNVERFLNGENAMQAIDNGDGTYTLTLTSGMEIGKATITGEVNGVPIVDIAEVDFTVGAADPATSEVSAAPSEIPADGSSQSVVTVQLKDANGNPLTQGGDTVILNTDLGSLS